MLTVSYVMTRSKLAAALHNRSSGEATGPWRNIVGYDFHKSQERCAATPASSDHVTTYASLRYTTVFSEYTPSHVFDTWYSELAVLFVDHISLSLSTQYTEPKHCAFTAHICGFTVFVT